MIPDPRKTSGATIANTGDEFKVATPTALVSWDMQCVLPNALEYIGVDDVLQVTGWADNSSNPLQIQVRILEPNGRISSLPLSFNPTASRAATTKQFPLVEGFLLSLDITSQGPTRTGQWTYATAGLVKASAATSIIFKTFCAGYVGVNSGLAYPETAFQRPTDGSGVTKSITGAVPAAGADISDTVPVFTRWRLISMRATLTTAITVANRLVSVTLDDGANIFTQTPSNFTQAASIVNIYNLFDSAPYLNVPFNTETLAPLPSNVFLGPGFRIRTSTAGIQATDQWSAAQYLVQEWLDSN